MAQIFPPFSPALYLLAIINIPGSFRPAYDPVDCVFTVTEIYPSLDPESVSVIFRIRSRVFQREVLFRS